MTYDIDLQALKNYMNTAENFNLLNRLVFTEVKEGYCEVEVALNKWSLNPQGVAHGSLIFTLCDAATGVAAATTGKMLLTQCAGIHFLRPGTGTKLRAVTRLVKEGRTTSLVEALVYDDQDRLVAKGGFTIYYTGGPISLPKPGEGELWNG